MKLDIVVASTSLDNVLRLCNSFTPLINTDIKFHVLLFNQKDKKTLFSENVNIFDTYHHRLPICDTRNICQKKLKIEMDRRNSIGMVLDDDKEFCGSEQSFMSLLRELELESVDMGFFSIQGDAPIPAEYTRASPLLDIALALDEHYPSHISSELKNYLSSIRLCLSKPTHKHHDFYSFIPKCFCREVLSIDSLQNNSKDWFEALLNGKSSTRKLQKFTSIKKSTGRERGGATLILNSNVLHEPNVSMTVYSEDNIIIGRRSDMVMAINSNRKGFKLRVLPSLFIHNRFVSNCDKEPNKLLSDILGYALVRYLENNRSPNCEKMKFEQFNNAFNYRIERTKIIIKETNKLCELILQNMELFDDNYHVESVGFLKCIIHNSKYSLDSINKPLIESNLEKSFLDVLAIYT